MWDLRLKVVTVTEASIVAGIWTVADGTLTKLGIHVWKLKTLLVEKAQEYEEAILETVS